MYIDKRQEIEDNLLQKSTWLLFISFYYSESLECKVYLRRCEKERMQNIYGPFCFFVLELKGPGPK